MVLKRQHIKVNESDGMEPRALKRSRVDEHDNKKGQGLDDYHGKVGRYVFLLLCLQRESNCSTDLGKGRKSLNHLLYIPKLPYQTITNFVLKFPGGGG